MLKTANRLKSGLASLCGQMMDNRPLNKLLLVMKLTIVLLTTMLTAVFATGRSQSVTFSGKDVPLKQVFSVIEKQTGFVVFSNRNTLDDSRLVTISASNMPLAVFLGAVLKDQPFEFLIEGKTIVLSPKRDFLPPSLYMPPPGRDISGTVVDEKTMLPVRGVSVVVNSTNKATQTDENGKFQLKGVDDNLSITFTSIGYEKQVVKVTKNEPVIFVYMKIATSELDQAVVQAYGITSKRLATGNIGKVTGEEIRRQPVMNPIAALQGKVPGLLITPTSGASSAPVKVEIRGRNSMNPNTLSEPLYVIDGIPQTVLEVKGSTRYAEGVSPGFIQGGASFTKGQSPFFNINPADIESIEVLKDGDATAIYGSRAGNGVILITTRKAKPGKTNFSMNLEQGMVTVPRYPQMLSPQQYYEMRREALKNDGLTPTIANAPDLKLWDTTRATDWVRELLSSGKHTSVSAGLSGGNSNTSFMISSSYRSRVDLLNRDGGNNVGTFRFNLNHISVNQKLSVTLSGDYAYSQVDAIQDKNDGYTLPPNAPAIFDKKGNLNYTEWAPAGPTYTFPFAYILQPNSVKTNNLMSNLSLSYQLMRGLTLSTSGRFAHMANSSSLFQPIAALNPQLNPKGMAVFGNTKNSNWTIEPQLQYNRSVAKGRLSVLVGATKQRTTTRAGSIIGLNYSNDDLIKSINNAGMQIANEGVSDFKYAALFGRINYNWDSKYILNLNARRDGSSRFAPGRQYGNFGSIGAAWIASEEKWIQSALPSWFSFLKLRGSMAVTGSDAIGDYQYLTQYAAKQAGSSQQMYTYNGIQPYVPILPVNQDYRWEELKSLEAGMNLGFLEDRINMELVWYRKRSGNQLTQLPTPIYTGFDKVTANWMAVVQNSGLEASIVASVIKKKELSLNFNFNIGRNTNKLIEYPGLEKSPYSTRYKVGESLNMKYLLRYTGVDPLTGLYTFEDYNKDGVVTQNFSVVPGTVNDDRYLTIDLNPKYQGGFGADFTWKNFSFNLFFVFINQMGQHPYTGIIPGTMKNLILPDDLVNNHWRKPGDNAKYARYSTGGVSYISSSDMGFVNASYLRLNNMVFNYAMPENIVKKAGLQGCNFSLKVQNVFTVTKYKMDPDIQGGAFNPIPRIFIGTLSFNL